MLPTIPTAETLALAAKGVVRAQDEVFNAWLPVVLDWCVRLGGPKVDAEDAAHDIFIVVLTRLDSLRDPARFTSWLYGITRRVLRDHRKRAWVRRWTGTEVPDVEDGGRSPEMAHARSEVTDLVQAILDGLPARQREVLVLCTIEERTMAEVSQLLDVPPGTIASRLRLARKRFEKAARRRSLDVELGLSGGVL